MKKEHHRLLWIAGIAGGGYLAYRFVYVPWAQQQAANVAAGTAPAGGGSILSNLFPTVSTAPGGSTVAYVPPTTTTAPPITAALSEPGSIPLPVTTTTGVVQTNGPIYSGPVGACMKIKGSWSASQCQTRLDAEVQAFNGAQQWIASYQQQMAQAQALLQANQQALANAQAGLDQATAAGDAAGVQAWTAAIQGHQADIANLSRGIAAMPAQLAAYQAAAAGNDNNYYNLTGAHIGG